MIRFIVGVIIGLTVVSAFAGGLSRELDCPPGGKLIIRIESGGGGGK